MWLSFYSLEKTNHNGLYLYYELFMIENKNNNNDNNSNSQVCVTLLVLNLTESLTNLSILLVPLLLSVNNS